MHLTGRLDLFLRGQLRDLFSKSTTRDAWKLIVLRHHLMRL